MHLFLKKKIHLFFLCAEGTVEPKTDIPACDILHPQPKQEVNGCFLDGV